MEFKMIRPSDVDWMEIELAKDFIRKPLSELFKAWTTLRDRDNVTMTIHELGHMMAWYALIRMQTEVVKEKPMQLEEGQRALPETSEDGN